MNFTLETNNAGNADTWKKGDIKLNKELLFKNNPIAKFCLIVIPEFNAKKGKHRKTKNTLKFEFEYLYKPNEIKVVFIITNKIKKKLKLMKLLRKLNKLKPGSRNVI